MCHKFPSNKLSVFFILFNFVSAANLSGTVVDCYNGSIANVKILCNWNCNPVFTNDNGFFSLEQPSVACSFKKPKKHFLQISKDGYLTQHININTNKDNIGSIMLPFCYKQKHLPKVGFKSNKEPNLIIYDTISYKTALNNFFLYNSSIVDVGGEKAILLNKNDNLPHYAKVQFEGQFSSGPECIISIQIAGEEIAITNKEDLKVVTNIEFSDGTVSTILLRSDTGTFSFKNFTTSSFQNFKKINKIHFTVLFQGEHSRGKIWFKDVSFFSGEHVLPKNTINLNNVNMSIISYSNYLKLRSIRDIINLQCCSHFGGFMAYCHTDSSLVKLPIKTISFTNKNQCTISLFAPNHKLINCSISQNANGDVNFLVRDSLPSNRPSSFILIFSSFIESDYTDVNISSRIYPTDKFSGTIRNQRNQPWIAFQNQGVSFSLNQLSRYSIEYVPSIKSFNIIIPYGTWDASSSAIVKFTLHNFSERKNNLRTIINRRYQIEPQHFKGKFSNGGLFSFFSDIATFDSNNDLGFGFHLTDPGFSDSILNWDQLSGINAFDYLEPHSYWVKYDKSYLFSKNEIYDLVLECATDSFFQKPPGIISMVPIRSKGWLGSPTRDINNVPYMEQCDWPWAFGYGLYPNPDPDINEKNGFPNQYQSVIRFFLEMGQNPKRHNSGFFFDSFTDYNVNDYSTNHFFGYNNPLLIDENGVIYIDQIMAYAKLAEHVQKNDLLPNQGLLINGAAIHPSIIPYTDIILEEVGSYLTDDIFGRIRSLAGSKPAIALYSGELSSSTITKLLRYGLSWGISINPYNNYWLEKSNIERDKETFIQFVPLIKILQKAGWQPQPLVVSNKNVRIERFGKFSDDSLFLTIWPYEDLSEDFFISLSAQFTKFTSFKIISGSCPFSSNISRAIYVPHLWFENKETPIVIKFLKDYH